MQAATTQYIRLSIDLAKRDLEAKHKRSLLGWLWLVLTPLCLLAIYTIVFGYIFGVSWNDPAHAENGGKIGFGLPFFVGLSVYLLVSDVVTSSAAIFVSKRTYVVKSPFPLWVIWLSNLLRACAQGGISLLLLIAFAIMQERLTWAGIAWAMPALLNVVLFAAAASLLLSAIGPFIGDISEGLRLLLRVLFYATPIAYPLSMVPAPIREWYWFNPLTALIEPLRSAIIFGTSPGLDKLLLATFFSLFLLALSSWIFNRLKGVVPDVV